MKSKFNLKLSQFQQTDTYSDLLKYHKLDEDGLWHIYGEDPDCDFEGSHSGPHLCVAKGKLSDVIHYAVTLPFFWQFGKGGKIIKVNEIVDVSKVIEKKKKLDYDARHEQIQKFHLEFKNLVRKYMPKYPTNDFDTETLTMMQDKTSCYNPYIWS